MRARWLVAVGLCGCGQLLGVDEFHPGGASTTGSASSHAASTTGSSATIASATSATSGTGGGGGAGGAASVTATSGAGANGAGGAGQPHLRVFVTSATFPGDFELGDDHCQGAADGALLGGSWRASLATSSQNALSHACTSAKPYDLVDGLTEVGTCSTFKSGQLQHPIDHDETGHTAPGTHHVWTGATASGGPTFQNCSDWYSKNMGLTGTVGDDTSTNTFWTTGPPATCDTEAHLYCFEQ